MSEAMLCIRNGIVSAIVVVADDEIYRETMAEWAIDPTTQAILRADIETARASFLMPSASLLERAMEPSREQVAHD